MKLKEIKKKSLEQIEKYQEKDKNKVETKYSIKVKIHENVKGGILKKENKDRLLAQK